MKFSICLDAVFNGHDFINSMKEIKALGINDFEFWSWWDKDLDAIAKTREILDMNITGFCTRFVSLVEPSVRHEYIEGLKESVEAAKKLSCSTLISQVGNKIPGISRGKQHAGLVEGLKRSSSILEKAGVTLVFEPLNTIYDHKGYYLEKSDEAFDIVDEVDSPYIKVLFDIYHQQITEGNLINNIISNIEKIGHFHAAGHPGRHELYNGEINYLRIIEAIDKTNFNGYMGLEYFPHDDAGKGLIKTIEEILNV